MKRFFVFMAIFAAILFVVSCNGKAVTEETSGISEGTGTLGEDTGESFTRIEETAEEETTVPAPDMPVFSTDGGIFKEGFELSLSTETGYKIRYNLSSDIPNSKSAEYKEPIQISNGVTVVRTALFDSDGKIVGAVATNTYIVNQSETGGIYTVVISSNQKDFDKIYSNPTEDIEVPAHVEIITPAGDRVISQDGGLKIFGGSSRGLKQKSLKIIARKTEKMTEKYSTSIYYGTGSFGYAFFDGRTVRSGKNAGEILDKYDSLILRNGGNDSFQSTAADPTRMTLLRDNVANNFAAEVTEYLDYATSTFAVVYVNGEYYGLLDMKENMNDDYVERMYGLDSNQVAILKSELDTTNGDRFDGDWFFYECDTEGEISAFEKLCAKAKKNIKSSNYQSVYDDLASKIDIHSFIEYVGLNLFVCNTDWPHNNVKIWRYTGEAVDGIAQSDGKWRFMTRDMDMAFGRYDCAATVLPELDNTADVDTFYRILGNYVDYSDMYSYEGAYQLYPDSLGLQGLFAFFMKNADFRTEFEAFCRKLCTSESTEKLNAIINAQSEAVKEKLNDTLTRWKGTYNSSYNKKVWGKSVKIMSDFADTRAKYFIKHLETAIKKCE